MTNQQQSNPVKARTHRSTGLMLAAYLGVSLCSINAFAQTKISREQLNFFEAKIRPVLIEHCYDCHSVDSDDPGGKLLLDTREGLLKGGQGGPAIVPGKPNSSQLLAAIKQVDPHFAMPPKDYGDKLPENVIADFEKWIRDGAPDPRKGKSKVGTDDESKKWWAWQPIAAPNISEIELQPYQNAPPTSAKIDALVDRKLVASKLTRSPAADRITLIRRLAIDLTGLPPSIEELKEFALTENPKPIEELVDRYLASERYGEHFGRHWLDVARYAESAGKDVNATYPEAYRYRDYVIDAFNKDLPFNHFIAQQIAGDLLPSRSEEEKITKTIATGFLAVGIKGLNERNPRQFAVDQADEQIDAVSQAFLGVTIACARCHDHKFDPISQRDYTALAGIFLSTKTFYGTTGGNGGQNRSDLIELPDSMALIAKSVTPEQRADLEYRLTRLQEQISMASRQENQTEEERRELILKRRNAQRLKLQLEEVDTAVSGKAYAMGVTDKEPSPSVNQMNLPPRMAERLQKRENNRPYLVAKLENITDSPQLIRGEIAQPGDIVPRGLPDFLSRNMKVDIRKDESGRKQLAQWISSPRNTLTSRVIVNRIWSWLIGDGIVTTEDNFGTSGELPSNQELLDFLAQQFVSDGWSTKKLVRSIVLSQTYQQASDFRDAAFLIDPENRLSWRANVRPVSAETLRDTVLFVSKELDLNPPAGTIISKKTSSSIGARRGLGISEEEIANSDPPYRSIYLPTPRNVLPDSLDLFDFADNSAVAGSRSLTIVPSQALYWMNSTAVQEHCEAIAETILAEHADDASVETILESLTLKLLSRRPLPEEVKATNAFIKELTTKKRTPLWVWTRVTRSLISSGDYRFVH